MSTPRWSITDATVIIRDERPTDGPRVIEGIAVPYARTWESPDGYRESFDPGAFADDAARWMAREDGARLPMLSDHRDGRIFLGGITDLSDEPDGLHFRAELRDTPAADEYAAQVAAGANGVSVEWAPIGQPRKGRDGIVHIAKARIGAIAGALTPAYDAARVAARDEDLMSTHETPEPTPPTEPEPTPEPTPPDEPSQSLLRRSAESAALRSAHPVTISRPELIYSPRSEHGFLSDAWRASQGDPGARDRQERHAAFLADTVAELEMRAGDVLSSELGGSYPSEYLPGLITERVLKDRPMGGFYDRYAITDGRPRIYAKVTTSTTVAVQSAEGVNPAASDFATTAVTVTPLLYGGETKVSRQVLDGADPAAEAMILNDLMESYAQTSEAVIKTAVEAGSTDQGITLTAATPHGGIVDLINAHMGAVMAPAQAIFLSSSLYSNALKQADSSGRLLMPWLGPTNAAGQQDAGAAGASVLGIPAIFSWASTNGTAGVGAVAVTGRRSDFVIFESNVARFSFDQGAEAPAAIRVGLWAYLVVGARRGSLKETAV